MADNEEICLICLNTITDRSLTDTCLHPFCLGCLRTWSQSRNTCPFCRQTYQNILSNVVSETQFQLIPVVQHVYERQRPAQDDRPHTQLIRQLRHLQTMNEYQERHFISLWQRNNDLDTNSIQYLQNLQWISDIEERIEQNHQRIAEIRQTLRQQLIQRLGNGNSDQNDGKHNVLDQQNKSNNEEVVQTPAPQPVPNPETEVKANVNQSESSGEKDNTRKQSADNNEDNFEF